MLFTVDHEPGSRVVKIDVTNEGAHVLRHKGKRLNSIGYTAQKEWAIDFGKSLGFDLQDKDIVPGGHPEILYHRGKKGIANSGFVIALYLKEK